MTDPITDEPKAPRPWRLLIGLGVVAAGFFFFVASTTEGGTYFLTVDEAMASAKISERPIRVKGTVVTGTYVNPEGTSNHSFQIHGDDRTMQVRYDGPLPDVFSEGREVIAEGKLKDGVLVATEVTAKCPSKYEDGQMTEEARRQMGLNKS